MFLQYQLQLFHFISRHYILSKPRLFSFHSPPTKQACISLLKNCKFMNHLKQIQAQTFLLGLHQDGHTLNKLIAFCTDPSLGDFQYAQKIFNLIQNPTLFIYNVMIKMFVKKSSHKNAILVFGKLREQGLWPDNFTYPFVFKAVGGLGEVFESEKIHGLVAKSGLEFDAYVINSLMDMYIQVGRVGYSKKLFDEMPERDVVAWNVLISGLVKCGRFEDAVNVFRLMRKGYVQFNRFDEAMKLFQKMQIQRVKPDKFVVVSLLTGCAQLGALEQGKWIHGYLNENRIVVDTIVGTALIEMYAKCGCVDKALEIFYGLSKKDTASWTSIICGLAVNGEASKALELFSEMKRTKEKPDGITFIGVLSACNHGGLVEEGREFFGSMSKVYQIEPKLEHYSCLIDLLGRAGLLAEVEKLIDDIPSGDNEIIVPLYGSFLSACRTYGNVEMGERVAQQLVEIESSDSSIHTLLANIYASADRWEDVTKVREKMKNLGVKKVPGCSSVEVNGVNHGAIT